MKSKAQTANCRGRAVICVTKRFAVCNAAIRSPKENRFYPSKGHVRNLTFSDSFKTPKKSCNLLLKNNIQPALTKAFETMGFTIVWGLSAKLGVPAQSAALSRWWQGSSGIFGWGLGREWS